MINDLQVYEGRSPTIYVCDPELIRLIFVKDFDHFQDRRQIDLGDPLVNDFLDFLPGNYVVKVDFTQ